MSEDGSKGHHNLSAFCGWLLRCEQFGDGFLHGLGNLRLRAHLRVHVVESQKKRASVLLAEIAQRLRVESVRLAHESPQTIAVNGMFVQRFGCPNQDLRLSLSRQDMCPERPNDVPLALRLRGANTQVTAQAHGLGESVSHQLSAISLQISTVQSLRV